MRTPVGFFMSENRHKAFNKPALSLAGQLELLESRGLIIPDETRALHYLKFIGYYRLSGYALPFQNNDATQPPHTFREGVSFNDILECYIFDRELRLLVMDAIERVEVAVRTVISNVMSEKHGPHWYMDKNLFIAEYKHDSFLNRIKEETNYNRGKEHHLEFVNHYYKTYDTPELPPSWMIAEVLSLGTWSIMFDYLQARDDQKEMCRPFGIHHSVMRSWLHALTYLRNLCAHHARLWNRRFTFTPKIADAYAKQLSKNSTFYAQAVVLHVFMHVIADGSQWQLRLVELLKKHHKIDIRRMGFPLDWQQDPFWGMVK